MNTVHKAFKSTQPFITYVLKDGTLAEFVDGMYHTGDINKINELMDEVVEIGAGKSKHPTIYVDENQQEVDPEAMTPYAIMEKNIRAKIAAENAAALDVSKTSEYDGLANFAKSIDNSHTGGTTGLAQGNTSLFPVAPTLEVKLEHVPLEVKEATIQQLNGQQASIAERIAAAKAQAKTNEAETGITLIQE